MRMAVAMGPALRGAVAAAIAAGAFITLRQTFHGDCLIPTYDVLRLFWFFSLPIVFVVAFVWLISEAATPLIMLLGRAGPTRVQAILAGVVVYVAIGASGYLLAPDLPGGLFYQQGMLVMSGNFSHEARGY